ncbi:hypothetical protein KY289_020138 [Solanum tuberosum]|nr:hypothetical protein KY289_020138 [Solanum tuberosum]
MWDKLEVTYGGIDKVKETIISQMKEGETIESIVLKILPPQWHAKVVTLENMNLSTLTYDEVRGDLIAFEKTHLNKRGQEDTKKKTVAFKANQEDKGEEE